MLRALTTPWCKCLRLIIGMRLTCNLRTTFCGKSRIQKCLHIRVMANLAKTPKSAIYSNSYKGEPREKGSKRRPNLEALKSPRRKSGYLLISMRLKSKFRRAFRRKPRLRHQNCPQVKVMPNLEKTPKSATFRNSSKGGQEKCPQVRVMTNLAKTPKSASFWNSSKRGATENGWKIRPILRAPKSPQHKSGYLLDSVPLKSNHRRGIWRKPRLQKCPQVRVVTNLKKTPKSAVFGNSSKGGAKKNGWKSRPTLGAIKLSQRKSYYLLVSIRLKSNLRRAIWRKPRLQKCKQVRVVKNLGRTQKSAIFWKSWKGGPTQNTWKSSPSLGASKTLKRKSGYLIISMR